MSLAGNFDLIAGFATELSSQTLAQKNFLGIVIRPGPLHFPPWVGGPYSGDEIFFSKIKLLGEISAEQGEILGLADGNVHRQHGGKSHDIVMPERAADIGQVPFIEIGAI